MCIEEFDEMNLVAVATLLFAAIDSTRMQTSIAPLKIRESIRETNMYFS